MNLQPTLKGKLITLKPLEPDEFDDFFKVASDPLIWEQHPFGDRYKKDGFKKLFNDALECQGAFAIVDNESKKIIGSSRYYNFNLEKNHIYIGHTFLARRYWGKPYNQEMKDLMLSHIFQFVDTVYFNVADQNIRSQLAMKKIGGVLCGKDTFDGVPHLIFKIDKSDWKRSVPRFKIKP